MKPGLSSYTYTWSYASIVENDSFSTLHILVEGEKGSVSLGPKFEIKTTTRGGTVSETVKFPSFPWADPDYIVNHESGIHINRNILEAIQGKGEAENTGKDNLETVRLIWACYSSAETGKKIRIEEFK